MELSIENQEYYFLGAEKKEIHTIISVFDTKSKVNISIRRGDNINLSRDQALLMSQFLLTAANNMPKDEDPHE